MPRKQSHCIACDAPITYGSTRCQPCANQASAGVPALPRSSVDNALKHAFRKVVGFDPLRDGAPPGTLFWVNGDLHLLGVGIGNGRRASDAA